MVYQNIQSLSCKVDKLRFLLRSDLNGLQILTLSETWAKRDLSDGELDIPGYKLFRKDRDGRNGGVTAYVRDDILVTRRDDLEIDSGSKLLSQNREIFFLELSTDLIVLHNIMKTNL